ncbi:MAG: CsbD family protein [Nitratireductor sp.]|nr:CsbD family protein [Nitratireductor sp.]MCB1439713.1 CsbD family protein [Nitratireductor sp.]MCC0020707.1 CsbD family protein [Nitratireductor sp.]
MPNKDQVEGTFKQVKGAVKDKIGEWTGDKETEAEGEVEKAEGKVQKEWGDAKSDVADAVDKA